MIAADGRIFAKIDGSGGGLQMEFANVTLASGAGTYNANMRSPQKVFVSVNDGTPADEGLGWTVSSNVVTLASSGGSSTTVVSIMVIGY